MQFGSYLGGLFEAKGISDYLSLIWLRNIIQDFVLLLI